MQPAPSRGRENFGRETLPRDFHGRRALMPSENLQMKIEELTAQVERLREYIRVYTSVECRGNIYFPEWAERALRGADDEPG